MNKFRMKELQNLKEEEIKVKQGVRKQLREPTAMKHKRYFPQIVGICASLIAVVLVLVLINPSEQSQIVQRADFSLSDVQLRPLDIRESYFIATSIEWNGDKEANLQKIELVDGEGKLINYDKDQIALRTFKTSETIMEGLYKKNEIDDFDEWANMVFQPQTEKNILFNVIANQQYTMRDDLQLKLIFDIEGQESIQIYNWNTLNNLQVVAYDLSNLIEQLQLSPKELKVYETYKQSSDKRVLQGLSPVNIARLYMLAEIEGNSKLRYAFYTTQPESIMWNYEDEQNFSPFDTMPLSSAVQLFQDLSLGNFVATSEKEGYISFLNQGNEAFFSLKQNQEEVWEVVFMPIQ